MLDETVGVRRNGLECIARRAALVAHHGQRSPCVLDRGLGKSRASGGTQRLRVGRCCAELLPARNAGDVRSIWALAGQTDLEWPFRSRRCGRCARSAGWNHVAERRILGTRWGLFPVRVATYLRPVGHGRKPRPLDPQSHYARRMVIEAYL